MNKFSATDQNNFCATSSVRGYNKKEKMRLLRLVGLVAGEAALLTRGSGLCMKKLVCKMVLALFMCSLPLMLPAVGFGDDYPSTSNSQMPPIGQQLVREGDFAVRLVAVLGVGTTTDEVTAESLLANVGISPLNGWIADYPLTPDIIGEIYKTVRDAADSGKITLSVDVALERVNGVMSQLGLDVVANPAGTNGNGTNPVPPADVVNNYYYDEGPPVVTYYSPPPDYYYLYTWVPYPFWWYDFWYPGYYILNDFNREVLVGTRNVFISNHFRDLRGRGYGRVDPVERFRGRNWLVRGNSIRSATVPPVFSRHDRGPGSAVVPRRAVGSMINTPFSRQNQPYIGSRIPASGRFGGVTSGSRSVSRRVTPSYEERPAFRNSEIASPRAEINPFRGAATTRMGGSISMPTRGGFDGGMSYRRGGFSAGGRR